MFIAQQLQNIDVCTVTEAITEKKSGYSRSLARLNAPCPACGKALIVTPKSVSCSSCVFVVWSTLAGKRLTDNQLETIIVKGKSSELEGFTSKAGKPFSAFVILVDKTTGRLGFDFPPRKGQ